jgi:hypothetical protein
MWRLRYPPAGSCGFANCEYADGHVMRLWTAEDRTWGNVPEQQAGALGEVRGLEGQVNSRRTVGGTR